MAKPALTDADRIRPLDALRAIRALLRNPDDTARVFEVIDALSGRAGARLFDRFQRSARGARLLRERPTLLDALAARERLLTLPPGSLGRAYAEFMTREEISADGLVAASESARGMASSLPEERLWFGARLRDMHDLWHVVTGYGRDVAGEAANLAFTYAQTRNRGVGAIVVAAAIVGPKARLRWQRYLLAAWRRGRRAAALPMASWEELLPLPLEEVRARLRIQAPGDAHPGGIIAADPPAAVAA
jgi:ubiquinone biosynthesis protein COQ4